MKLKYIKIAVINIVFMMLVNVSQIQAIELIAPEKVDIGQDITVVLDFKSPIAAYDSLIFTYNNKIMKYNSAASLIEGLWWDTSKESKGIDKKIYSFTATGNGICTFDVKMSGVVSANYSMDIIGDVDVSTKVTVGDGILKGDLEGNGIVDANDASIALDLYKYNNATEDDIKVADMDGNDIIDANDASLILDVYKYGN